LIRTGTAGWSYADWEGVVYPRHKGPSFHPLRYLSHYIECVEVNSTFYAHPARDVVAGWSRVLAGRPNFVITAKLHKDFTHADSLAKDAEVAAGSFLAALEPILTSQRLRALLAQFPVTFQYGASELRRLSRLHALFGSLPLVLELRHASWFQPPALNAIRGLGCSLAHIDLPAAWNHPPTWFPPVGGIGYLRLHGRNKAAWFDPRAGRDQKYDYLYTEAEVGEIAARTQRIAKEHDETFVITNNHFTGKALVNALQLIARLRGQPTLAPAELAHVYPELSRCTRHGGQQELF
jgi:uncharacterized protein YecE (DUF72 family)